jgi:hypothetical protein
MKRDEELPGDYGYDLVHEDIGPVRAPADPTGHGHGHGSAPPPSGKDDVSTDVSYDEAHDF